MLVSLLQILSLSASPTCSIIVVIVIITFIFITIMIIIVTQVPEASIPTGRVGCTPWGTGGVASRRSP